MSRGLPRKVREHLKKARESCLAAVALYNNPTAEFRSGSYIVLMVIAWTSLFHAIFYQRRQKPWVVQSGTGPGIRYVKIGSQPKHWELRECLRQYFDGDNVPVRDNLIFLADLRDQIEHRDMPELDNEVFGECQAALLNFEQTLADEFGDQHAINASLSFSLQLSGLNPDARANAMKALRRVSSDSVMAYVRQFRSELSMETASDQRFAFRVFLVPQLANHRTADTLAAEFVHFDPEDSKSMTEYEHAMVLMKQQAPEGRTYAYLPRDVAAAVESRLPWEFGTHQHTQCWRFFEVRPAGGAEDKSKCDANYCHWDSTFRRYVYSDEWIEFIATELSNESRFIEVTRTQPTLLPDN